MSEIPVRFDDDCSNHLSIRVHCGNAALSRISSVAGRRPSDHLCHDLRLMQILAEGLQHVPYLIEAVRDQQTCGVLPLAYIRGPIFGRFLVSLPYINSAGIRLADHCVGSELIDEAVRLTDRLDCRYLELRHENRITHSALKYEIRRKVHMRLALAAEQAELWTRLRSSVRNQIRKADRFGFCVNWGGLELLNEFYSVFSRRMRELGTPVYSRQLFASMLTHLSGEAELCVVRDGSLAIASALLLHGRSVTDVSSAAALTRYNSMNANMLMYWHLLKRSVERDQQIFDFGRCTIGGPTHRFKKQWGAQPHPAVWQYYIRRGSPDEMRPDSGRRQLLIRSWRRLPLWLTRLIGPTIVRGIP